MKRFRVKFKNNFHRKIPLLPNLGHKEFLSEGLSQGLSLLWVY